MISNKEKLTSMILVKEAFFPLLIAMASHVNVGTIRKCDALYKIRSFHSSKDQPALEEICRDVWGGTDYLPHVAASFEEDPCCDFVVMEEVTTGKMVAVGNRRVVQNGKNGISWLESIRTSKEYRGQGLATALLKALISRSLDAGLRNVNSCTIKKNFAMIKAFGRVNMHAMHQFHAVDFSVMASLPGWGTGDCRQKPENILKALNVEQLVDGSVHSLQWSTVQSEDELNLVLRRIRDAGGIGQIPAIGKLLFLGGNLEIRESMKRGLIRKLERKDEPPALFAICEDSMIQSLQSKWVCSIVAADPRGFEAALWEACSRDLVESLNGHTAFALILDGCGTPIHEMGELCAALPFDIENPFILHGTQS